MFWLQVIAQVVVTGGAMVLVVVDITAGLPLLMTSKPSEYSGYPQQNELHILYKPQEDLGLKRRLRIWPRLLDEPISPAHITIGANDFITIDINDKGG